MSVSTDKLLQRKGLQAGSAAPGFGLWLLGMLSFLAVLYGLVKFVQFAWMH